MGRGFGNGDHRRDLRGRRFTFVPQWWWGSAIGYSDGSYYGLPYYPGNYYGDDSYDQPATDAGTATSGGDVTSSPAQDQAKATNELEGMPEFAQTQLELKKNQAAYDTLSRKALDKLKSNSEYQGLVAQREAAQDQVEAIQASARGASPERVLPTAQRKLELSARITRMEQDAIAADPEAAAAKAKIVELTEKLTTLRKQAQAAGIRGQ
jgi:hypothetical protein